MKTTIKAAIALPFSLALTALVAAPSLAGSLTFATNVEQFNEGVGIKEAFRRNTANALGAPQLNAYSSTKDFLSLGVGGSAIFSFGTQFTNKLTLWETTWGDKNGKQSAYDEQVEIFASNSLDGTWTRLGLIKNIADGAYNTAEGASLSFDGVFQYLKLVDKSAAGSDRDGFDVNGIGVQAVPEPFTIAGMALGASGMIAARRRRAKQNA
ncbi:PEP-CTERM sorting domain-containing protein [Kamptonema sp. UHCC 0994]|uniref:PEP-CTERM sorting domain-containing protein n=1 Tax=Kamptonema sp. UHCC 0994 TaxID=3031329 RepID=UPI0023B99DD3|nr:PEP-CTERM sorting domain-containing protein [Kamptonema sp. UHCC 0994]MDF0553777.1 PEP-CTERM sorting domain-containing protein [Kamptonema sp. UHCC 0994]